MAPSRTRSAPPAVLQTEDASLAPWVPAQSLAELKDAMGSPGVIQAEVDALLAAIARPPAGDETPRARADFLLSLMDLPEEARDRTGSDGRTVRAAALEALMALGYPYALEVHPDVLEDVRQRAGGRREARQRGSLLGPGVTVLALFVQLILIAQVFHWGDTWSAFQVVVLGMLVSPPLLAILGQLLDWRGMQSLGVRGMTLQGLAGLLISILLVMESYEALRFLMIPWYVPLLAAYLMRTKPEPGDETPRTETP